MNIKTLAGDCRETLKTLPEKSIHMAITSPPYWSLRSYLPKDHPLKALELGSEKTPEEFVANLVGVFREVRRVLRDDGVIFVNIGDTYSDDSKWGGTTGGKHVKGLHGQPIGREKRASGIAAGNRMMIPARFALAMQLDGWILRDEIIWHKPAPMPSSVDGWRWERHRVKVASKWNKDNPHPSQLIGGREGVQRHVCGNGVNEASWIDCPGCPKCSPNDGLVLRKGSWRTTAAHEMIYMFSKTGTYFCDREAVATKAADATIQRNNYTRILDDPDEQFAVKHDHETIASTANLRSVWSIASEPLGHKHYAAFPSEIPSRCIRVGTSSKGVCPACGAPWARIVEKSRSAESGSGRSGNEISRKGAGEGHGNGEIDDIRKGPCVSTNTLGWRATCSCPSADPIPATVLDPFGGSGTTALEAKLLGRNAIQCELSPEYIAIIAARQNETSPLFMGGT